MKNLIIASLLNWSAFTLTIDAVMVADPLPCIKQKCPNEWAACQKDPKCEPVLQDCQKKCGTGATCWALCLSKEGDTPATNVAKCAQKNGCLSIEEEVKETAIALNDPLPCIKQKCPNEWAACQKDPKCEPVLQDCQKKCGTGATCWALCLSKEGDTPATNVAKCAQKNGCLSIEEEVKETAIALNDPLPCIKQKCPNEWAACQKDPKCEPVLQDCQKKCGTGATCWALCLSKEGDTPATNVAKCAQKNGCLSSDCLQKEHPFEKCMFKSCFSESVNCLNEKECRNSLLYCRDPKGIWQFSMQCLIHRSQSNEVLSDWFHCVGNKKCL